MKKATLVCDLQYGSTGKGLIAGYLAERDAPDVVVTAWGANSGHTYIDAEGRKYVHTMLANGVVSKNLRTVLIGPGSLINLPNLIREATECKDHLENAEILIHPHAAVIQDRHVEEENNSMVGIGSTRKGCGSALIEKIQRQPYGQTVAKSFQREVDEANEATGVRMRVCRHDEYMAVLYGAERILVEGAQGYSLGINSGFYPYVTSRECTPAQMASDTLLPLPMIERVVGVLRTYPIRVANRYDDKGNMVGWSGPCYPDQHEITFGSIGQPVEKTTVTKLPRRIFTLSRQQCRDAMLACRPDEIALGFMNYADDPEAIEAVVNEEARGVGCGPVAYHTWGPTVVDVTEV